MANPHPVSRRGKPNKASTLRAERLHSQGRKRPDEELVDLFYYCKGQAARFQPEILDKDTGERIANPEADIVEHGKWVDRAHNCARDAAPYYAAKRAAVTVDGSIDVIEENRLDPRQIMWETYIGMRRRGELAQKTIEAKAESIADSSTPVPEPAIKEDDADGVAV